MANIIFDLDGTLWNTVATAVQAWNEALKKHDLPAPPITESQLMEKVGMPRNDILADLFPAFTAEQLAFMAKASATLSFQKIRTRGGKIYPEVMSTLRALQASGHQMYIVSNCQEGYIDLFLDQTQSHSYFLDQECWGNTLQSKSENIKLLMQRNALTEACYVGDTTGDFEASQQAGTTFIHATYGFGNSIDAAQLRIDQFNELLQFF